MPTIEASEPVLPHGTKKTLPLNSGRLTAAVMGRLGKELGLSVLASFEDMRQIVSGANPARADGLGGRSHNFVTRRGGVIGVPTGGNRGARSRPRRRRQWISRRR